ncbi:urease accessory protein UreD [Nonomuraea sp. NPDC005983]|uniref:urease accessory protein UreD n=1 Tax=Nonomuraea sp. NPDC005983 TaxID=3155595 RepID=UPI0033AD5903
MIATSLAADGRTVLSRLLSAPPLTLRQTGPHAVRLVSTAAGPLGGDDLELRLDLAPGTTLDVGSVAATLVLPGDGESSMRITATVGESAVLRFTPEPTVLAAGCAHRTHVQLALAENARVLWREELVFGRYGETPGRCHARFDATLAGRPLLRQEYTVGDPLLDRSPAVYGDARCIGTALLTLPSITTSAGEEQAVGSPPEGSPTQSSPTGGRLDQSVLGDGVAVLPLAGPAVLVSALAGDAVELRQRLEWGESVVAPGRRAEAVLW